MSKTTADYLRDLLQELDDIVAFTIEGEAAFMRDVKTQKAVIRSYEVIGEIGKRLPDAFRAANSGIDWRKLITFRDFLAHNYELIGLRYVWDAVKDVHNLRAAIQALLDDLPDDEDGT
ncbi:MAG: DUF86 domain-containing protein [Anaerolineaceae bacterium]|nr:MAG: DUF86 domain-containing protein [Anaerolineaceae bacterium]